MIPEHWTKSTFGQLANFCNGYPFKPIHWGDFGVPIIRIAEMRNDREIDDYCSIDVPEEYVINDGDLLFSWSATLLTKISNFGRAYLNQHIFRVEENDGIDKIFLKYLIDYCIPDFKKLSHGMGMQHITLAKLQPYEVFVPPRGEQIVIGQILSSCDSKIESSQNLVEKLEMVREGMLEDLLSLGVREDGRLRDPEVDEFQETERGRIPVSWTISRIDELSQSNVGIVVTPAKYYTNSGILVLRGTNVKHGSINLSKVKYMSQESHDQNESSALYPGDIVVVRSGQPGSSAVIPESIQISNAVDLLICRTNENILPHYLSYYINTIAKRKIASGSHGSVQQHFNLSKLRDLSIAHPENIEEQHRILNPIQSITERIETELRLLNKYSMMKTGLQNDLLTGKRLIPHELLPTPEALA